MPSRSSSPKPAAASAAKRLPARAKPARASVETTKADYERLAAFRYALRKFIRFSEEQAVARGLTPQQHQALLAIQGMPGRDFASIGELAERLQLKHHTVVGLVDRLETDAWLTRMPAAEDKRRVVLRLTTRSLKTLAAISEVHRGELTRLGPELKSALSEVLKAISA